MPFSTWIARAVSFLAPFILTAAAACRPAAIEPTRWQSTLLSDHPLVGRIYDVRAGRMVDEAALRAALPKADFVLLGETHDNPDHHELEARLIRVLTAAGRRPAAAFEMLDAELQPAVDETVLRAPHDPDALARAVGWKRSGWPDFALYRPVFLAALDAGLQIVAANLPRRQAHAVVERGLGALDPAAREILEHAGPLTTEAAASLRAEMAESHCGTLPESALDDLVLMQRARDAELAERMLTAQGRGAVLVAGAGHVRRDRGVPLDLAREAPSRSSIAVAFLEVAPELTDPKAYSAAFSTETLPFDYVLFTPQEERQDPCAELRRDHPRLPEAPSISL